MGIASFITKTKLPPGYSVIDLETTVPLVGVVSRPVDGAVIHLSGLHEGEYQYICRMDRPIMMESPRVIAGHNIKFDLDFGMAKNPAWSVPPRCVAIDVPPSGRDYLTITEAIRRGAVVLDTQYITYLHSGHAVMFGSLEDCCAYWGVPILKTMKLSEELPKYGNDITKVPGLEEYLRNDLEMTSQMLLKQLADPWVIKNFAWILAMHDGLLGTLEIERNGMHVDPARLATLTKETKEKFDKVLAETHARLGTWFDPASNDHVGKYLFGGSIEEEDRMEVGVYMTGAKLGQPRYKINRIEHIMPARYVPDPTTIGKSGKPSVNEEVLSGLVGSDENIALVLQYRELQKLLGTYLVGLSKHVKVRDGKYYVFPSINVCGTATGRTSSSKPNMQNNPTHDSVGVASIYTSRYGEDGILLEVDFKQIEVIALAVLSGDRRLADDILRGRDIHTETGGPVFGGSMTKEQRRIIKTINFGLIYGGGAKTLAAQAGVPVSVASNAINSFYNRYPEVKRYFETKREEVNDLLTHSGRTLRHVLEGGFRQKECIYESVTGRRYAFRSYFDKRTKEPQASYTETRNYPIQGLATGDLVLTALGHIWRHLLPKYGEDVKLVGVVHDSLRFDLKVDRLESLMVDLKYELENSHLLLNRACKKDFWKLPVKVSFSKGASFFSMEEL